ncbi:hypothetical protein ACIRP0_26090 [Streptomyces sp. NPDC101733]|uniref:hypothetical protein n=1 Tax=unclassified Streptomyces TaxID=2593676 RepID=UPI0037FB62BF
MAIESDHLVYEYLSRVGDLAQRRQLSSGDRMRLVSGLRDEIDRRRAKYEPETPAAVRRILERIGTPEEVLDTLGTLSAPTAPTAPAPPPAAPSAVPEQRAGGLRRRPAARERERERTREPENVPPHLAGLDELGPGGGEEPDWWRLGATGAGPQVEGFAGGIEIPDLFKERDPRRDPEADPETETEPEPGTRRRTRTDQGKGSDPDADPDRPPRGARARRLVRVLRERRKAAAVVPEAPAPAPAVRRRLHVFLTLAALLLVAGSVSGYWLLLGAGWLLAYASRVLGPAERKWVLLGVPATVLAGAVVWLWGRRNGRWGEALAAEALGGAFQDMWPLLARVAALTTAAYLAWRARR